MNVHGQFKIYRPDGKIEVLPNLVTYNGGSRFLDIIFRGAVPTFFLGLMDQTITKSNVLTDVTTEPTTAGGYARIPVARSSVGWPTLDFVNGIPRIVTALNTFTATGAPFSRAISRVFLATTVDNTGYLLSVSAALSTPITLASGESLPFYYEVFNG